MIIEGTWEEVSTLSDKLSGRNVKLVILPEDWEPDEDDFDSEPPMTWEEWKKDGENFRAELAKVWPKGLSALDAVLEQRR